MSRRIKRLSSLTIIIGSTGIMCIVCAAGLIETDSTNFTLMWILAIVGIILGAVSAYMTYRIEKYTERRQRYADKNIYR